MHCRATRAPRFRFRPPAVACAILFACVLGARVAVAQEAAGADTGQVSRLDSISRLMAGLPPSFPAHVSLARTREWRSHSRAIRSSWSRVRDGQLMAITAWRDTEIPRQCPVGPTLLYPFSGPDFANAYIFFPGCKYFHCPVTI